MISNRYSTNPFSARDRTFFNPRNPRRISRSSDDRVGILSELTTMVAQGVEAPRLIDGLMRAVGDEIGMETVGVATRDDDAGELVFRGGFGWSSAISVGAKIPTEPDSPAHQIFVFGKPMVLTDRAARNGLKVSRRLFANQVTSGLAAPMIRDGSPFGILAGFSTSHHRFGASDIDFFQTAANLLNSAFASDEMRRERTGVSARARREAIAKASFIANASHELRSPLNVILGYCEVIGERLNETGDPNAKAWMQAVERAGNRLLGTVDDILDYSRIESGTVPKTIERVHLAPLVEAVVHDATPAAVAKRIGLSCAFDSSNVIVAADRRSLTIALTKLVNNAIKFTEQGAVEVRLKAATGSSAMIEIHDTGVGIAADYLPRLFEPFSQERDNYARPFEGIGLGLTIARHFLELNGGQIAVQSAKGRGSTFTVHLPKVSPKPLRKASAAPPPLDLNARRQPLITGSASR